LEALFARKAAQLAAILAQVMGGAGRNLLGVSEMENRVALPSPADSTLRCPSASTS
jgi:hypothetical protein